MDAFFAAVEQRDFPQYLGRPVVVGGMPNSRGVVATCSYEARKYGIHSAMPASRALLLCPQAIFLKPRFDAYRQVSHQIRQIFQQYTELTEPLSLDEAYLDVTQVGDFHGSATLIAQDIKNKIKTETGLTASAGISYNKFLAKIASDMDKPDGIYLIKPEQGPAFVEKLPIGKFHGIGKATEKKMQAMGIEVGRDLKRFSLQILQQKFGKAGNYYYDIVRGIDERPVNNHRVRKSFGVEITFQQDIDEMAVIFQHLQTLFVKALTKITAHQLHARTITIKIKYDDFELISRSKTLNCDIIKIASASNLIQELISKTEIGTRKVRLLGVSFSSLESHSEVENFKQLDIFE
jgi:DNA polymerase IV